MNKKLLLSIALVGLSSVAFASGEYMPAPMPVAPVDSYVPGIYVGIMGGYDLLYWNDLDGTSLNLYDIKVGGNNGFIGGVYAGYDFHKNFAIEAGYNYFFHKPNLDLHNDGVDEYEGNNPYVIYLAGKIKANVADNAGLFAMLGADYLHSTMSPTDVYAAACPTAEDIGGSNFNVMYGAGLFYDITPNFIADLSWMRYDGNSSLGDNFVQSYVPHADAFFLRLAYKFPLE